MDHYIGETRNFLFISYGIPEVWDMSFLKIYACIKE